IVNASAAARMVGSTTSSHGRDAYSFLTIVGGNNIEGRGAVSAWLSNGFTISWTEPNGTGVFSALCLKLESNSVSLQENDGFTDTSSTNVANTLFTQKGAMLLMIGNNESGTNEASTKAAWSCGAWDGTTQNCQGFCIRDGTNNTLLMTDTDQIGCPSEVDEYMDNLMYV